MRDRRRCVAACDECGAPIYEGDAYYEFLFTNKVYCSRCAEQSYHCGAYDQLGWDPDDGEDDYDG